MDITSDSLDAIERLKKYRLDVIILDLIMPRSDGFVLLEHLAANENIRKPEVVVLSSMGNDSIIRRACKLGASYYMMKPFSMADLHERILNIVGTGKTSWARSIHSPNSAKTTDQCISELLSNFGISPEHKGYRYIYEAVNLVIGQPDLIKSITKQLYPRIGAKFGCSPLAVERSIRHTIGVAYNEKALRSDESLALVPHAQHQKFTNGEFISLISSRVQDILTNQTSENSGGHHETD